MAGSLADLRRGHPAARGAGCTRARGRRAHRTDYRAAMIRVMPARTRQAGTAVVLAMLLAAFAAVVAATVFADQQRWSRNVENRRDRVQGAAIAMAGLQWARQILYDDARSTAIDHLGETWALSLPPIPLDNGEIRGAISDAQARLNINDLGDAPAPLVQRLRLSRLFARRGGPVAALPAITDWIAAGTAARAPGTGAKPAAANAVVAVANAAPVRVAELAGLRSVSTEALGAVRPFLTALPPRTAVNVNTAPIEVLDAMFDGAPTDALAALVAGRRSRPFATVAEFRARLPEGLRLATEEGLDVKSQYFEVTVEARQGTTVTRARALVRREPERWPTIVWEVVE
ncbi:MAG: type II secretion system minor pseudopilin GspK [Casimicrobiaceae bacterium]